MVTITFNIPERNDTLRLKEAELERKMILDRHFYIHHGLIGGFLDYCAKEKKKALNESDHDKGYINQLERRIDKYAPEYEMLRMLALSSLEMEDAYNKLSKSGEI